MADKKLTAWRRDIGVAPGGVLRAHRLSAHGAAYSWFVRGARYVLPFAALVIAGLVLAQLMKNPLQDQLSSLPAEERTLPGQSTLEGARYEGNDSEGRPFVLRAERAVRVLPDNATASDLAPLEGETVDLTRPSATLTMDKARALDISASEGRFVQDASTLDLTGGVTLSDPTGNELWVDRVNVDLNANTLTSETPVRGRGPDGTVDAEGLRLENGGEKVIFTGRTTLTLPASPASDADAQKDTAP